MSKLNDFELLRLTLSSVMVQGFPRKLCKPLVHALSEQTQLSFVSALMEDALAIANDDKTLLRQDSGATTFIGCYLRERAGLFLSSVCLPTLRRIATIASPLEMDPSQVSNEDELKKNEKRMESLLTRFIKSVHQSLHLLTEQVREVLRLVWKRSNSHSPGKGSLMVASCLFLRLVIPALVSPHKFGLSQSELPTHQLRIVVQLGKSFQRIVNGEAIDSSGLLDSLVEHHHTELINAVRSIVLYAKIESPNGILWAKKTEILPLGVSQSPEKGSKQRRMLQLKICHYLWAYLPQTIHLLSVPIKERLIAFAPQYSIYIPEVLSTLPENVTD